MKKINVITRHSIVNYGSFLQTFATQSFFESIGCECEIIHYISKNETVFGNLKVNSKKRHGIKRFFYLILKFPDEAIKTFRFHSFLQSNLNLSKRVSSLKDLREMKFDGYLCSGSDQLWGYMPNGTLDPAYFLDFGDSSNKKFSYSSSFGREDFIENDWNFISSKLKKLELITVREQESSALLLNKFNLQSTAILDPTFLIDEKIWFSKTRVLNCEKYLLVYQLRPNKDMDLYIKKVSKIKNLRIIRISTQMYDIFKYKDVKVLKNPWTVLSFFRNAELIITDSFHATVFSILFQRNFIDILPPYTSMRIVDLITSLGLSHKILNNFNDFDIMDLPIDYVKVNEVLDERRKESKNILLNYLNIT